MDEKVVKECVNEAIKNVSEQYGPVDIDVDKLTQDIMSAYNKNNAPSDSTPVNSAIVDGVSGDRY